MWPFKKKNKAIEDPISMVLLHQQPRHYQVDEIQSAAARVWQGSADEFTVMESNGKAILHVGGHMLSLVSVGQRYLGNMSSEFEKRMQNPVQRSVWARHTSWTAVDYLPGGGDIELKYCVLARFIAELLDSNCLGIYMPGEQALMPHDPDVYAELKKMGASRDTYPYLT